MKNKNLILPLIFFFSLLCSVRIQAQRTADLLTAWSGTVPIEKVHLHFDRDNYLAGETAWFKAYLYSDYQPDTISTSLYVELLKDSSTVIKRAVLPVFLGNANGQLELPDTLATGNYLVRAYTPTMLNNGTGYLFQRQLFVYGKQTLSQEGLPINKGIRLGFFPEGGNMVAGFPGMVAFKATDGEGRPLSVSGSIYTDKGTEAGHFTSQHDGMGMFELTPSTGSSYYALLANQNETIKYPLPAVAERGVSFSVIPHPQGSFFELKQKQEDPAFQAAYMIGQMQHHVVFKQNFSARSEQQGVINTQHLRSGILQITVFNKDDMPLAERLCFVDNKEYRLNASLKADTVDFNAKARNRFSIHFADTVQGGFSVSIIDDELSQLPARQENIFSSLLLTGDLNGYIHNPAYYFSSDGDSVKMALDLVMMTNGWRRFHWEKLVKEGPVKPLYRDKGYIDLSGQVFYKGTKKAFTDKQLVLIVTGVDGKRSTQFLQTNSDGNFRLDSMLLFERTNLVFSDVRGKKSQYIDVLLGNDSLRRHFQLPASRFYRSYQLPAVSSRWKMDYAAIEKVSGIMLEEIRLKSFKKSPQQLVEERYTTGMFSGDASKSIDLVNTDEASAYQNIFDYLQFRVNGLAVNADGFDYSVYFRQGASISSMGPVPMTLFLDEIETDASVIASIPASQVALVKLYSSFAGATGNAPGGVLAIYTKKGQDYLNSTSGIGNVRIYNGYSIIKEFYSPDYKKEPKENTTDNRITLLWRPNIFLNAINPVVQLPFYNNDRTKQYRIVVEGLTVSGKMLCTEQVIRPAQKAF